MNQPLISMKWLIAFFFVCLFTSSFAQSDDLLVRFPAISPDGSVISFSFQGDIWTMPTIGGKATRLTVHEAYETNPVFSPDGKQIAFSGSRYGNDDVFVMPTEGGVPKRLTFHSSSDNISTWSATQGILFTTAREYRQVERPLEVYAISAKGGTESRILDAVGFDPAQSPNGRFIAFTRGDINPIYREDYRGPSDREIWLYDSKNKTFAKIVDFETNDILPRWGDDNTLYFLSTNSGRNNLYKIALDADGKVTGSPEQLTTFSDHSIRYYSISGDGKTIVYERGSGIFTMNTATKLIKEVPITISADQRFDPVANKTTSNGAEEFAVSPNGKLLSIALRGEIYVTEAVKDKSLTTNLSSHPYRDMDMAWLNDSLMLFTSDRADENFDIYMVKSADKQESSIFKSMKHDVVRVNKSSEDESSLVVSPDGKKLAFMRGRGKLVVSDIAPDGKLSNEKILHDSWSTPRGLAWSPDSKWLAYSVPDLYFNEEVFIQAADNSTKPVNVSMHPRGDGQPFWSADGSKLGFVSERNNLNRDVWFAWLKKADWEKSTQDWEEFSEDKADSPASKKETSSKPVVIDFDNIHMRLVQVTSFPGDETNVVISKDGDTFYYTGQSSTADGRDIYSIKWNGKDLKEITKGGTNPGNLVMDKDGKYLFYSKRGGSIAKIDTKTDKSESISYSVKQRLDFAAEREQVFEEAWRTIRDGFYDPQFHGNDWEALRLKYKPLSLMASTNEDFAEMFNYMLGELNASHMGLRGTPERADTQNDATGMLGVELLPTKEGMKVVRVIPNSPADRSTVNLKVNEVIVAVNGQAYNENENFYAQLNTSVNERTLLQVKGLDGKIREVVIRPASSLRQLLYDEWVEDRKKLVDQYSNGRLGYIHIQAMNGPSFEVFERELQAAGYGKEGLVIDVRYNGGGSTTDLLMTILNYKQHAYTIPRGASENLERDKSKFRDYYPIGERLVFSAWLKPSIAICNEGSYSNAEIFSHAYKNLGIGKLVGVATNGSVISTGGRSLIDGSYVRLPFRGWFTKATDVNQELGPAIPDIEVANSPDWITENTDAQLKRAAEELLKEIDSKK
jgi:tricorn protease